MRIDVKTSLPPVGLIIFTILTVCFGLTLPLRAGDVLKDNNANDLNLGTSWLGGSGPGTGDIAVWSNNVTAANSVLLGADLSWAGIRLTAPGGDIAINTGNKLTLGSMGITNGSARNLTLNCQVEVGADQTWNQSGTKNFIAANVSGLNKTLTLMGKAFLFTTETFNNFTGTINTASANTRFNAGGGSHNGIRYNLTAADAMIWSTTSMTLGSLDGVAGSKLGGNVGQTAAGTFIVGGANVDATFAGIINNGGAYANSIEKAGTARWTLSGTNYYSGTTTVSGGTLIIDGDNSAATGAMTVDSGAILGGSGIIGGATTVNGMLNPGNNSPGALTLNEALTLGSNSTTRFEIVSASSFDVLKNDNTGTDAITFNSGASAIFDFTGNTTLTNGSTFSVLQGWESVATNGVVFSAVGLSGMSLDLSKLETQGLVTVISDRPLSLWILSDNSKQMFFRRARAFFGKA